MCRDRERERERACVCVERGSERERVCVCVERDGARESVCVERERKRETCTDADTGTDEKLRLITSWFRLIPSRQTCPPARLGLVWG